MRAVLPALLLLGACAGELAGGKEAAPAPQASRTVRDVTVTADSEVEVAAGGRITPVLVTVRNHGEAPARVPPSGFDLVRPDRGAVLAARRAPDSRRRQALPAVVLAPGETASGYVFFDGAVPPGTVMDLLARVETAQGAATAVLPLRTR